MSEKAKLQEVVQRLLGMRETLKQTQELSTTLFNILSKNAEEYKNFGSLYIQTYKEACLSPCISHPMKYDSLLFFNAIKKLLNLVKLKGDAYINKSTSFLTQISEGHSKYLTQVAFVERKLNNMITQIDVEVVKSLENYMNASVIYEEKKKTMIEENYRYEEEAKDPLMKFIISVQEVNLERLNRAIDLKNESEAELVGKQRIFYNNTNKCNKELKECERLFKASMEEVFRTTYKTLVDNFANCCTQVSVNIKQELEALLRDNTEAAHKTVTIFKEKAIEKHSLLRITTIKKLFDRS